MKCVNFEEANESLGNGLPGYYNVPVYRAENATGDMIMKVELSPEEIERIAETGCFWYTRQTGGSGLQPFSFSVEKPFVQMYEMKDLSPENIEALIQPGTTFRNLQVSPDFDIIEILSVINGGVSFKLFNGDGSTNETKLFSFAGFSSFLKNSKGSDQWQIVNPKI